jgi:outer membrane protein assembly factor BamB
MVYVTQGMRGPLLAVRLGGSGERPRKDIAWRDTQGTPDTCCPVVWEDMLFTVSDDGIARCFDALNGKLQWKERLKGGQYRASPLAAHGRIYFLNTAGLCTVVSASRRFDKLTENQLDDVTFASPAVSDRMLFIRGRRALYCIGP